MGNRPQLPKQYNTTKFPFGNKIFKGEINISQYDKLLDRIKHIDKNLRFEEITKVLKKCGFEQEQPSGGSSHYTFRKEGALPLTIPKHIPIKPIYIKKLKELLEREGIL